jgi:protein involved in polysaccharide export with SLBB domain
MMKSVMYRIAPPTRFQSSSSASPIGARCFGFAARLAVALFAFGSLALLTACDSVSGSLSDTSMSAVATSLDATAPADLKVSPGDKLRVTVFGEDKLSGDYDVDPSGYLSIPLGGTVMAAGLSKPELEALLTKKLKGDYLRNPKVTVDVVSFRPFYILGEVEKPGEYPYKGNLNVLTAIAIAGGNTFRASNSTVLIKRANETTLREYPLTVAIPIYPGDLVKVPERYF